MSIPLIAMVAGEASGDFLGAHLIGALRRRLPQVRFAGIGGTRMESAGFETWFPMERLAVRGYVEVLRHYPEIAAIRRKLRHRILAEKPALFVGIDAPDFNLGLEAGLKRKGITTIHFVSPSVWAWRGGRVRRIARSVNQILVLFPFEEALYQQAGVPVAFVGHPLADAVPMEQAIAAARDHLHLPREGCIFALLPGSRISELHYMARTFVRTARLINERLPQVQFVVPLVSRETRAIFEKTLHDEQCGHLPLTILFGHAHDAIAVADAVLVASGTATLEAALYRKPMVITYRMAQLTWRIMSRMHYQPYVGLPNVIAGEFIVPELVQDDAIEENLAQALINVYRDPTIQRRLPGRLAAIHQSLRRNAAERAADAVLPWLKD